MWSLDPVTGVGAVRWLCTVGGDRLAAGPKKEAVGVWIHAAGSILDQPKKTPQNASIDIVSCSRRRRRRPFPSLPPRSSSRRTPFFKSSGPMRQIKDRTKAGSEAQGFASASVAQDRPRDHTHTLHARRDSGRSAFKAADGPFVGAPATSLRPLATSYRPSPRKERVSPSVPTPERGLFLARASTLTMRLLHAIAFGWVDARPWFDCVFQWTERRI